MLVDILFHIIFGWCLNVIYIYIFKIVELSFRLPLLSMAHVIKLLLLYYMNNFLYYQSRPAVTFRQLVTRHKSVTIVMNHRHEPGPVSGQTIDRANKFLTVVWKWSMMIGRLSVRAIDLSRQWVHRDRTLELANDGCFVMGVLIKCILNAMNILTCFMSHFGLSFITCRAWWWLSFCFFYDKCSAVFTILISLILSISLKFLHIFYFQLHLSS